MLVTPVLAAHADWSVAPAKRWMSVASPAQSGWRLHCEPVGDPASLLPRLLARAGPHPCVLGVDAPIGLPLAYASAHWPALPDFPSFLRALPPDSAFFSVCDRLEQVAPARPFFPRLAWRGPGRDAHAARLGIADPAALLRRCDQRTTSRRAAACLFWTLGANQVGKAALALWRDVLTPALHRGDGLALWPFEGPLATLLQPGRVVVAETYPAESIRQLALPWSGSKRRQPDRAALAPALLAAMQREQAAPDPDLAAAIHQGFGSDPAAEDRFDSLLGLLGLLHVLAEPARDRRPDDPALIAWEGWILGQTDG